MLAEKAEFPVKMMARVLGVSRSGFYSWLSNGCPREDWSAEREAVRRVWLESDRRFGFRFQDFSLLAAQRPALNHPLRGWRQTALQSHPSDRY